MRTPTSSPHLFQGIKIRVLNEGHPLYGPMFLLDGADIVRDAYVDGETLTVEMNEPTLKKRDGLVRLDSPPNRSSFQHDHIRGWDLTIQEISTWRKRARKSLWAHSPRSVLGIEPPIALVAFVLRQPVSAAQSLCAFHLATYFPKS